MPSHCFFNTKDVSNMLRKSYLERKKSIKNVSTFPSLFMVLLRHTQCLSSKSFILTLASALVSLGLKSHTMLDENYIIPVNHQNSIPLGTKV